MWGGRRKKMGLREIDSFLFLLKVNSPRALPKPPLRCWLMQQFFFPLTLFLINYCYSVSCLSDSLLIVHFFLFLFARQSLPEPGSVCNLSHDGFGRVLFFLINCWSSVVASVVFATNCAISTVFFLKILTWLY